MDDDEWTILKLTPVSWFIHFLQGLKKSGIWQIHSSLKNSLEFGNIGEKSWKGLEKSLEIKRIRTSRLFSWPIDLV